VKKDEEERQKMPSILRRFNGIHRGEQGMTLIELVVVVAILGMLAAIIVPNVVGWIGEGEEEAARTELYDVQLAMTAVMAKAVESAVEPVTPANAVYNLTGYPKLPSSGDVYADLDGDPATGTDGKEATIAMEYYLLDPVSERYKYSWNGEGKVSQHDR
jgi:prepilin-type N-terminal cleavage/methylation domain-containing protein